MHALGDLLVEKILESVWGQRKGNFSAMGGEVPKKWASDSPETKRMTFENTKGSGGYEKFQNNRRGGIVGVGGKNVQNDFKW